jgi:hypothetical protein
MIFNFLALSNNPLPAHLLLQVPYPGDVKHLLHHQVRAAAAICSLLHPYGVALLPLTGDWESPVPFFKHSVPHAVVGFWRGRDCMSFGGYWDRKARSISALVSAIMLPNHRVRGDQVRMDDLRYCTNRYSDSGGCLQTLLGATAHWGPHLHKLLPWRETVKKGFREFLEGSYWAWVW